MFFNFNVNAMKYVFVLTICILLVNCTNDNLDNSLIVSQWQLTSRYSSPGGGEVVFTDVQSDKVLTFRDNGVINSTEGLCSSLSTGTYDAAAGTISSEDCTATYSIDDGVLQINGYQCVEQCSERYTRIN